MRLPRFTLFRLFLLLALAGLAAGGVVGGRAYQRHAELQTLLVDMQRHRAAISSFRTKYGQLPGDFRNATALWGRAPDCTEEESTTIDAPTLTQGGSCNGDGDGLVESTTLMPTTTSEFFLFWQHLALAGMVEGSFTGLTGGNYAQCILGTNCPALGARGATAIPTEFNWEGTGSNGWWGPNITGHGNWLALGAPTDGLSWPFVPLLSVAEASGLDTKSDDGKPASGSLMMMGCQLYQSGCMVDDNGAQPTPDCDAFARVARYQTGLPGRTCTPMWRFPG